MAPSKNPKWRLANFAVHKSRGPGAVGEKVDRKCFVCYDFLSPIKRFVVFYCDEFIYFRTGES